MNSKYNMPGNYQYSNTYPNNMGYTNNSNDDRLIGPVFPFLLGGVTGAALAPAFWRSNNNPYYYRPPYGPYPYYSPFYR